MRHAAFAALMSLALIGAAAAQTPTVAPAPVVIAGPYGEAITLDRARQVLVAAEAGARQRNLVMAFAVVDPAGDLVAFARMDGVQTASVDIALAKAASAARFRRPTRYWADAIAGGRVAVMSLDGVVGSPGGVPILDARGRAIGAIGASGGTGDEDEQVAIAAIAARR